MAELKQADPARLTALLRALADPARLRIVGLLAHGELCVCHLQGALGVSQPFVSRHLAVLRRAGVVADRRRGSWVYYRLAPQSDVARKTLLRGLTRTLRARTAPAAKTRCP